MLTLSIAGAMNVVDAEPIDGVDFKNGVLAYITLVRCPMFCCLLNVLTKAIGHRFNYNQRRLHPARR